MYRLKSAVCYFNPLILSPGYFKADTRREDFRRSVSKSGVSINRGQNQSSETDKVKVLRRQVLGGAHGAVDLLIERQLMSFPTIRDLSQATTSGQML